MMRIAPTPFEQFASDNQFDTAPAVFPAPDRVYADRQTQAVYDAFNAGAASVARMLTESALDTEALREKMRKLARDA